MSDVILDSSAVLACLQNEPGDDLVRAMLTEGVISAVNYTEVITKLIEWGATPDMAEATVEDLSLRLVTVDGPRCIRAGRLHARTIGRGISLGDRFCLALAEEMGLPVLTGDKRWKDLELGIEVTLIR